MSHHPRVSVLVPAWNDGSYLDAALRSLAGQTWQSFEVVVADDGSSDETPVIATDWAARDPRFRLLRSDSNRGMAENWNSALRAARGELVAKLDADDTASPDFLAAMVPEMADPATGAVFCRTVECDEQLRPVGAWDGERAFALHGLDPARRHARSGRAWLAMSFDDHQLWHSNAFLVRTADLINVGGWDERWSCAADTDLILRLLERDGLVVHVPAIGVSYRRRQRSVSARADAEGWRQTEGILVALRSLGRCGRALAPRSAALRQNWWRLWKAYGMLGDRRQLLSRLPEKPRAKLAPLLDVPAPPAWLRVEREAKALAWRALRGLRGLRTSPAEGAR